MQLPSRVYGRAPTSRPSAPAVAEAARRVLAQGQVRPARMVVIVEIVAQETAEVLFAQNDHVVEQLPPQCADHPLHVWGLPGRSRGDQHLVDAQVLHAISELGAMDAIAVTQHVARRRVPWEGVGDLLRRP